jgi:hypothetical protein
MYCPIESNPCSLTRCASVEVCVCYSDVVDVVLHDADRTL